MQCHDQPLRKGRCRWAPELDRAMRPAACCGPCARPRRNCCRLQHAYPDRAPASHGKRILKRSDPQIVRRTERYRNLVPTHRSAARPEIGRISESSRSESLNFVKARAQHSAVESAINALEVHGLARCPDHGIGGFERCVALAVVARNIHRIGAILREQENGGPSARAGTQIVTCRTNWRHSRPSLFPWSDSGSQRRRSPECYGI